MDEVDVAVVGGGPGGTAAARAAAERGVSAVVLEKGVPRADRPELGPDSTDAAGFLDFWADIADVDPTTWPDDVIQQELSGARFVGPTESVTLTRTGIDADYPSFGFTFDRAAFDDWHREQAVAAGAEYRVGTGVKDVETDLKGDPSHTLLLADGSEIEAGALVLADGPQRQVTMRVLDRYLPEDRAVSTVLSPRTANHIAYQEYRKLPPELFDPDEIAFWWGWIPGHTAYPWIFPNDDNVARVGLTMPIGLSLEDVENPQDYELIEPGDTTMPSPREFLRRFLERQFGDEYDVEADLPRVESLGKDDGTETYPISSTRPIESPTGLDVAVVGGAMGATSAFHEGGDHVALRTGKIAGRLAAAGNLDGYNAAWKNAIGREVRRNVTLAEMVRGYEPADWDRAFSIGRTMLRAQDGAVPSLRSAFSAGIPAVKLYLAYRYRRARFGTNGYLSLRESAYQVP